MAAAMTLEGVVAQVLGVDASSLTDESGYGTLEAWTSLRHINLIMAVEEYWEVSFTTREIQDTQSLGALRALLRRKGKAV